MRHAEEPGGIVRSTDLYYPGQRDPIGLEGSGQADRHCRDRLRYVVWICRRPDLFPDELSPRLALHVNHPSSFLGVRRASR